MYAPVKFVKMEMIVYKKTFALHVKSISTILEKIMVTDVCKLLQIARINAHSSTRNSVQVKAFKINGILVPFFKEEIKREEKAKPCIIFHAKIQKIPAREIS